MGRNHSGQQGNAGMKTNHSIAYQSQVQSGIFRGRMDLSLAIVSYNCRELLRQCLMALPSAAAGLTFETFVIDNASGDGTAELVANEFPEVVLLANSENVGFARASDQGLAAATGRALLLLNPDTVPGPGSLRVLAEFLDSHPDVGAVGPRVTYPDGRLQPQGGPLPTPGREMLSHVGLRQPGRSAQEMAWAYGRTDFDLEADVEQLSGVCLMVSRDALDRVGPLDTRFFMFYEDVEWCRRIREAGYRVVYVPSSVIIHHWMGSVRLQSRRSARFLYSSMRQYYSMTGPLPTALGGLLVSVIAQARSEILHTGSAIKQLLRKMIHRGSGSNR